MSNDFFKVADEKAIEQEVQRQKKLAEEREANNIASLKSFPFFIKGTNVETKIILLAPAPVTFNSHAVTLIDKKTGNQRFEFLVCKDGSEVGCPICSSGGTQPTWKGAIPILDMTPWTDNKGVTYTTGTIKLLIRPFSDIQALLREVGEMPTVIVRDISGIEKHIPDVKRCVVRVNKDGINKNVKYSFRYLPREGVPVEASDKLKKFFEKYPDANDFTKEWLNAYMERIEKDYNNAPDTDSPKDEEFFQPTADLNDYSPNTQTTTNTSNSTDEDIPF